MTEPIPTTPTDFDKSLKRILNGITAGVVVAIEQDGEVTNSRFFINGIQLAILPHLVMTAYVHNAEKLMQTAQAKAEAMTKTP